MPPEGALLHRKEAAAMSRNYSQEPYRRSVHSNPKRSRRRCPRLLPAAAALVLAALVLMAWKHSPEKKEEDTTGHLGGQVISPDGLTPPEGGGLSQPEGNNTEEIPVPDWIVQDLLPVNEYSRPGDALPQVNGVVIHYVGNPGTTARQNRGYFASLAETHETSASSHFVVGMDGEIIQCVPLGEISYCSSSRNVDTIAIECCHPDTTGAFTQETLDALTRLVNWLIETYDLEREDILRHYDVTGKECPRYFYEHPDAWEAFRDGLDFGT